MDNLDIFNIFVETWKKCIAMFNLDSCSLDTLEKS